MPIDINLLRADKGGNPEAVRESQRRRFKPVEVVDEIIDLDNQWRKARYAVEQLKKEMNQLNKAVGTKKKANKEDPCEEEVNAIAAIRNKISEADVNDQQLLDEVNKKLRSLGNIVDETVPVSETEDDNRVERTWGTPTELQVTGEAGAGYHHQILAAIGGYESDRGVRVAGHRAYYLTGPGVLLNLALINYGVKFLAQKQYTPVQPPFMLHKHVMAETAELADFDEQLYKIGGAEEAEGMYLIATSEQPISTLHRTEWLDPKDLPYRYAGVSTCFRREAGSHGRDTWGIFRVHQFEKVEQFIYCKPEESKQLHEEMIALSEEFYQSLQLPYRVVSIVSKELNLAAAKKYDLEAWFPGYQNYRELVSCSNCTDWQARGAEVRCGKTKQQNAEKKYVHMLNGTLCATERTMCCILENYQTPEGVRVPEVLQPYTGCDFFPFVKEFPKMKAQQLLKLFKFIKV